MIRVAGQRRGEKRGEINKMRAGVFKKMKVVLGTKVDNSSGRPPENQWVNNRSLI